MSGISFFDRALLAFGFVVLAVTTPLVVVHGIKEAHAEGRCHDRGGVWIDHQCVNRDAILEGQ